MIEQPPKNEEEEDEEKSRIERKKRTKWLREVHRSPNPNPIWYLLNPDLVPQTEGSEFVFQNCLFLLYIQCYEYVN